MFVHFVLLFCCKVAFVPGSWTKFVRFLRHQDEIHAIPSSTMAALRLPCLLVAAALLLHAADAKVEELTPKNFKTTVLDSQDAWMVLFYAPWCGHCKAIFPEWKKMAEAVHPSIKVAQVNADEHKELGGQYGVQGFPTIKVFLADKKRPQDYKVCVCMCVCVSVRARECV
jgi:protein disulfide-isomerase-like protein